MRFLAFLLAKFRSWFPASPSIVVYRDRRKRIGVPKHFLEKIGAQSYAVVYCKSKGNLYISNKSYWDLPVELYKIDSKGNIKISNTVLKEGGFEENEPVALVLKKKKIRLEKVS